LSNLFLSIPYIDDGYNHKNEEHLDDFNSLSNIGTKMNDIFVIPSLLSHLHQESFTLVSAMHFYICLFLIIFQDFLWASSITFELNCFKKFLLPNAILILFDSLP